jgi:peptide/nickel transport system substrate-binding protein
VSTTAKRLAVLAQIQSLAAKDLPTIPYWQGNMIAVSKSSIHGVDGTLDAAFYMRFWQLSKS